MTTPALIRELAAVDGGEIVRHLQRLSPHDRRMRFGAYLSDAGIERYVRKIDFSRDRVFGVFELNLGLTGVAHLALDPRGATAELGLSVDVSCRGRGYGFALLSRGRRHATMHGCTKLFMHCLAQNQIMIHLARKAGMMVVSGQGEADAFVALTAPAPDGARPDKIVTRDAALVD